MSAANWQKAVSIMWRDYLQFVIHIILVYYLILTCSTHLNVTVLVHLFIVVPLCIRGIALSDIDTTVWAL